MGSAAAIAAAQAAAPAASPRNLPPRCAWCPRLLGCRVPAPFAERPGVDTAANRASRPFPL